MYKIHFLSCLALTLAFVTDGAPTSSPSKETRQHLEHLMLDLQGLLSTVNTSRDSKRSTILTFKFYMPRKATELKHLQCLIGELGPLEDVLKLVQNNIRDSVSNIKLIAEKLQGPEVSVPCDYEDDTVTVVEFLSNWVSFCQGLFSTLT